MAICARTDDHPCSLGCELRRKGVMVAPSSMPSRMNSVPPAKHNPWWERTKITDKRPDGSEMPVFAPGTRNPLRVKEYTEKRRQIDGVLSNYKTRATPLPG